MFLIHLISDNLKIKDEIIFDSIPLDGDGDDQNLTRVEHNDVGDPSQGRVRETRLNQM